ncbi:MAG TPA: hypothetical protein VFV32_06780 [Acidimicrobiales bacterium]|nr:hypothetical protein [Acidimicrobiales bacterium]
MASTCSRCGTVSTEGGDDGLPAGWSLASSRRGVDRLCTACTREHVRDIEAKLDEEWWG